MRMTWDDFVAGIDDRAVSSSGTREDVTGIALDSRKVQPGDAFFCIRGENFDGHDFAGTAIEAGARVIVTERTLPELCSRIADRGVSVLSVQDSVRALGDLAHSWRRLCADTKGVKVVGVTGTAGKTTVKEVLATVLATQGPTAKNHLNLNNQIGLPQSMLATQGDEAFWVMEVGISRQGDMDELGPVLEPDVAIILNAGAGHTAGLGRNVARHKARLLAWLAPGGLGLVGADYPELVREAGAVKRERPGLHMALCGTTKNSVAALELYACRAEYLGPAVDTPDASLPRGNYRLFFQDENYDVVAPFQGVYGAENVSMIAAVARHFGLSADQLRAGLVAARLPAQRNAFSQKGSWRIVDDSYNANPLSSARMLESVGDMARRDDAHFVCVLGEMLELGSAAEEEHRLLGERVAASGAKLVLWHGGHGEAVQEGLARAQFEGTFVPLSSADELAACEPLWAIQGGVILFKGSRGNRLESAVSSFVNEVESRHAV